MPTRQTVPRLEALGYVVRSLWGFHVIYGSHGEYGNGQSHDKNTILILLVHVTMINSFLTLLSLYCK